MSAQALDALRRGNERRAAVAAWRRKLTDNPDALITALDEQPAELGHVLVCDLLVMARANGRRSRILPRIGRQAVRDGVNLLVPLGEASGRTRRWASQHAVYYARRNKGQS